VDHVRRITQAVLDAAQEVALGAQPPRHLASVVLACEGALDNAHREWKRRLFDLRLDTDAASDPWTPHGSEQEQRLAVLTAAEPHLSAIRDLLGQG
jgi:hypothetical protein